MNRSLLALFFCALLPGQMGLARADNLDNILNDTVNSISQANNDAYAPAGEG